MYTNVSKVFVKTDGLTHGAKYFQILFLSLQLSHNYSKWSHYSRVSDHANLFTNSVSSRAILLKYQYYELSWLYPVNETTLEITTYWIKLSFIWTDNNYELIILGFLKSKRSLRKKIAHNVLWAIFFTH